MARRERTRLTGVLPLTRRQALVGAGAAGGLAVAFWLWPRQYDSPLTPADSERGFGGWLAIGSDGVVSVAVPQLEMGQGVMTVLAQIAAVELGADWRQVAVEPAPPSGLFANTALAERWAALWSDAPSLAGGEGSHLAAKFARESGFVATAEGTALASYEAPLRAAAAQARGMLVAAAAERWNVAPEECEVAGGIVRHGDKALGFGALVEEAALLDPPEPPPLRAEPAAERPEPGMEEEASAFPRLDLPAKVDGSLTFAADIRVPGMVYAAIRHAPWGEQELARFDTAALQGLKGVVGVVRARRWIAVAARSWWIAEQALNRMAPVFSGPQPPDSTASRGLLAKALDQAREDGGETIVAQGDGEAFLRRPDHSARYSIAPAAHGGLETASATARLADGRLELWIASQAPEVARRAVAEAVGVGLADVVLYPVAAGGAFDARLEKAHAIEAAIIAKEIGLPVQLTWSRTQELQALPPRTPVEAELAAGFFPATGGKIAAWRARLAMPATTREFGARLFDNRTENAAIAAAQGLADPLACEGAVPPYTIPNVGIEHVPVMLPLPTARMRGNAAAYTAFFTECFLDELAEKAGRDPLLYRMDMLGQSPRSVTVLRQAARMATWDGGRRGTNQGLAFVRMGSPDAGGRIACVAEATLDGGGVRVTRLFAAVDIGRIVNLDIARQQIEGGLVFGLGTATGAALQFVRGKPVQRRLRDLKLPRLADSPEIVLDFVASDAQPFDPGELGVAAAAPAIANALHSATGTRFRRLPFTEVQP